MREPLPDAANDQSRAVASAATRLCPQFPEDPT
eukprot:COSAG02_NODE_29280_length_572_cov_1.095137_1_plen_32_part_10